MPRSFFSTPTRQGDLTMVTQDPILILGGVDGIGGELARRLTAEGYQVALSSRTLDRASLFANEIGAMPCAANVLDESSLSAAVATGAPAGRLAGLVYAVGSIPLKPLGRVNESELIEAYRVNVVGAALAVKHAASALKAGNGAVVLFSSVAATQGFPNHSIIGPAKAAVAGLTLALAAELAPDVRVNAISPSLSRTPLAAPIVGSERMAEAMADLHPLKRLGTAQDSAALAAFLLSAEAGWITGQIFGVDGGRGSLRVGKA
jgi:NAD(P)-dependent dehydrogenase (short-subunit alcohol dehydrogenase family)